MARVSRKPDAILLGSCIALVVFGILILASVSAPIAYKKFDSSFYFLKHQVIFGLIPGLIGCIVAFKADLKQVRKWAPFLFFASLLAIVVVVFPKIIGLTKGTVRWLDLKITTVQPAEFLKLTAILYWASWWHSKSNQKVRNKNIDLLIFVVVMGIIGLLFALQPDVSTFGVIVILAGIIYFLGDSPFWHSALLVILGICAFAFLMQSSEYRQNRLSVFLNPDTDPMGIGYQLKQALITVGSGGITGVGIGFSEQKFGFLPELISDSIFAVFAEETGFIGSFILLSLFTVFFWRGLRTAYFSKDKFNQLTAAGITSWIIIQTLMNIMAMTGVMPLTGIPLPFVSYGGSALISELIGLGLLLNISTQT